MNNPLQALVATSVLAWTFIIIMQVTLNFMVQRKAYSYLRRSVGRGVLLHVLGKGPGTVVHELAHIVMAKAMGFNVTDYVLYGPKKCKEKGRDGYLGFMHWETGAKGITRFHQLKKTLVSAAPGIIIPPILALITFCALGTLNLSQYEQIIDSRPGWLLGIWAIIMFLCGRSMFPSTGDHFTKQGLAWLGLVFIIVPSVVVLVSPQEIALFIVQSISMILAPATFSAVSWIALFMRD